jgi:hypothetical protein
LSNVSYAQNIGNVSIEIAITDLKGKALPADFELTILSKVFSSYRINKDYFIQYTYPVVETGDGFTNDGNYKSTEPATAQLFNTLN